MGMPRWESRERMSGNFWRGRKAIFQENFGVGNLSSVATSQLSLFQWFLKFRHVTILYIMTLKRLKTQLHQHFLLQIFTLFSLPPNKY